MATNPDKPTGADERTVRKEKIDAQAESIIGEILRDRPKLRSIREANSKDDEPANSFAQEFLNGFRQKLQGQ